MVWGGRSQIIRMIKTREYFAYRAYFAKQDFVTAAAAFRTFRCLPDSYECHYNSNCSKQ